MKKEFIIANELIKTYEKITNYDFRNDELKLQKLMYFLKKMYYAYTGEKMFDEKFQAWVHGPVLKSLRGFFDYKNSIEVDEKLLSDTEIQIIEYTIYKYAKYSSWKLRDLSHEETAWNKARIGLKENERSSKYIKEEDIKNSSKDIRLYDYQWDMYYDEFEDDKDFQGIY